MSKDILYHQEIRQKMLDGVNQLADTIAPTLGPKGRNVLLGKAPAPDVIANSGAQITDDFSLENAQENMGAQIVREMISRVKKEAGDGSSTAVVLTRALINEGMKNLAAGANPMQMKKGIQGAAQLASAAVRKLAVPADLPVFIQQTAASSVFDLPEGGLIVDALRQVGRNGVITVEESQNSKTTMTVKMGMEFERELLSPYFADTPGRKEASLENPYLLITDYSITAAKDLLPVLEKVKETNRPLLIIAEKLEGEALTLLIQNKLRGILKVAAIHPPAYGDGRIAAMEDLAVLTGGTFVSKNNGILLERVTLDMLGTAQHVTVSVQNTAITGGGGSKEAIRERVESLRTLLQKAKYDFDKEKLRERLARFESGIAVISVGGDTETEVREKKLRLDSVLHAVKAAAAEGIVAGGGAVYLHILTPLKAYAASRTGDERLGAELFIKALEAPAEQIAENAGYNGKVVTTEIKQREKGIGFDVLTGEYRNMKEAGIVDAAGIVRLCLQCAASAASIFLSTEAGVTDRKE